MLPTNAERLEREIAEKSYFHPLLETQLQEKKEEVGLERKRVVVERKRGGVRKEEKSG